MGGDDKAWSETDVADLTRRWLRGDPTQAIGLALHRSKNSVVGKAHRLHLQARPSPIKRLPNGILIHMKPSDPDDDDLPPLPSPVVAVPRVPRPVVPLPPPPPAEPMRPTPRPGAQCRWPIGHPGAVGFHFCGGATAELRLPYCPDHCRVAYPAWETRKRCA